MPQSNIKSLAISTAFNCGGAGITAKNILLGSCIQRDLLSKEGLIVDGYYVNKTRFNYIYFLISVFIYRISGFNGFGFNFHWIGLIRKIRSNNYNLLHLHNVHGYYMPNWVFKYLLSKYKCILTIHDYHFITGGVAFPGPTSGFLRDLFIRPYPYEIFNRSKMRRRFYEKLFCQYQPNIVCVSSDLQLRFREAFPKIINCSVIYNGIKNITQINQFKNFSNTKVLWIAEKLSNPVKGYKLLLDILPYFKYSNIEFHICGGFSGVEKFFASNVTYYGRIDENQMKSVLDVCNVYLSTSYGETFGRTLIESLVCGLDLITTNLDVFKDVVGEDSIYYDPSDSNSLVDIINRYDPKANNEAVRLNRALFYSNKYSIETQDIRYRELYYSTLQT